AINFQSCCIRRPEIEQIDRNKQIQKNQIDYQYEIWLISMDSMFPKEHNFPPLLGKSFSAVQLDGNIFW
ncbi:hypothetical protein X798_03597, partial [Onchocerca flexuosa]